MGNWCQYGGTANNNITVPEGKIMTTADVNILLQSIQQIAMTVFSNEIRRITDITNPTSSLSRLMEERDIAMQKWMKEAIASGIHESFKLHKHSSTSTHRKQHNRARSLDHITPPRQRRDDRFRRKDEQAPLISELDPGDKKAPASTNCEVEFADFDADAVDGKSLFQTPQSSASVPGSLRRSADTMFQEMDDRHQSLVKSTSTMSPVTKSEHSYHDMEDNSDDDTNTSLNASLERQQHRQQHRNWDSLNESAFEAPTGEQKDGEESSDSSDLPLGLDSPPTKLKSEQEELAGTPSIIQRVKERAGALTKAKAEEATAHNTATTKLKPTVNRNLAPIFNTTPAKSSTKKGRKNI